MRHNITIFLLAVLSITGIGLAACRKEVSQLSRYQPGGDTKTDTLRMMNLLYDSTSDTYAQSGYVLYVNDSMINFVGRSLALNGGGYFNNQPCYGVPGALAIPSGGGTFNLKLAAYTYGAGTPPQKHPDNSRIVCQTTINVPAHSGFGNVFFYDSAGKSTIRYMPQTTADPGAPAAGTFKVRVVNFGYALEDINGYVDAAHNSAGQKFQLQLQTADSVPVKGDETIPFGAVTPYTQYAYGTWQFLVYNSTMSSYITNCGPLNDQTGTFDLSTYLNNGVSGGYSNTGTVFNYLYPNYTSSFATGYNNPTLRYGNIGSYPFSAGCCYTILVVGNMYAVVLDRQYGAGSQDNYGHIQLVNAAPGQTDLQVAISAGSVNMQIPSLPFGSYIPPLVVPAGNVTCTFSSHGQTLYTYSTQVPRLSNFMLCYSTDLKKVSFVFPYVVTLTPDDYAPGSPFDASVPPTVQYNKISCLALSPDAGNIYFTNLTNFRPYQGIPQTNAELPVPVIGEGQQLAELPYKGSASLVPTDGSWPAQAYYVRLSSRRTDSLANELVASLPNPFPTLPAPGTFTLVAAGLLDASDPSQAMRIILVRNSNFIPKAQ